MSVKLVEFDKKFITKDYLSWLNNSNLMRYSEQRHKKHTYESSERYIKNFLDGQNLIYAIIDIENNKHVGNINAYIDYNNNVADIGILVGYGGRGYGKLAWRKMINILFTKKNIRKISGGTAALNNPMIKIFESSGMTFEYSIKKHLLINNEEVDLVVYCVFNEK